MAQLPIKKCPVVRNRAP